MKRGRRILLGSLGLLLLAVLSLPLWIDAAARTAVERGGSYALGVKTTLQGIDLSLFGGDASLTGLTIGNPAGFASPHFLDLRQGSIAVTLKSVLGDKVEVPSLVLEGLDLRLDRSDQGANYDVILAHVKRLEGEKKPEESSKSFVIREVILRDVRVDAKLSLAGVLKPAVQLRIEEIRFTNVGEEGIPMSRVYGLILKGLLGGVLDAGSGILPDEIAGGLKDGLGALAGVGELGLRVVGEGGKTIVEGGKKVVEEVLKPLDGIFGRKEKKEGD
ncbi:MAG: AsmA family protein [Planctomycetaceae bacterium]